MKMDTTTRVQILDEIDCISHCTNTLGKGMNPIILPPESFSLRFIFVSHSYNVHPSNSLVVSHQIMKFADSQVVTITGRQIASRRS